jgi:hypothetical protein
MKYLFSIVFAFCFMFPLSVVSAGEKHPCWVPPHTPPVGIKTKYHIRKAPKKCLRYKNGSRAFRCLREVAEKKRPRRDVITYFVLNELDRVYTDKYQQLMYDLTVAIGPRHLTFRAYEFANGCYPDDDRIQCCIEIEGQYEEWYEYDVKPVEKWCRKHYKRVKKQKACVKDYFRFGRRGLYDGPTWTIW